MIIFKSILRKKTTKIYLFIVTGIFLAIGILFIARNHYIVEGNKNYEGSYYTFLAPLSEQNKVNNAPNIKEATIGLIREFSKEDRYIFSESKLFIDKTLNSFEIKIWETFTKDRNNPDIYYDNVSFTNKEDKVNFKVVETYQSTGSNLNFISQEAFDKLYDGKENVLYLLIIDDFFKKDKTEKWLEENVDIYREDSGNGIEYDENSKSHAPLFELYVKLFTFLLIALGVIFTSILIYTIINLLIDEKKNSNLLKHLGYKNSKILITKIGKITLVVIIPIVISSLILIPLYLLW